MFETLFVDPTTVERYRAAPLCAERVRYLEHCRDSGFSQDTLEKVARNQLRLVLLLDMRGRDPVTVSQIEAAAETWSRPGMLRSCFAGSPVAKSEFVHHMRGWLRYLGRLEEPEEPPLHSHTAEVAAFAEWARAERGYAEASIASFCWVADQFFAFLAEGETETPLASVSLADIDRAFAARAARQPLRRGSIALYAQRLRVFFRFAESRGWCARGMADGIKGPRIYANETLPPRLTRDDALRVLATTEGDRPSAIRDRAVLLLLITYGLRSGEVRRLTLDDFDWKTETLLVRRSKSGRPDLFPLSRVVAKAIIRYIRDVRPSGSDRTLFCTVRAPIKPLTQSALGCIVRSRFRRLGVVRDRRGPHALRHAAAQHLLGEGLSMKEIGDFLGHRSPSSTAVYARVDLNALRQVADFDLGGVT